MDKAGVNVTGALAKLGTAVGKLAEGGLGKSSRLSSALTSLNSQMAALQKQEDALLTAAAKLANGGKSGADSNPISKAMQQAYLGQSAPPTGP